MAKYSAIPKNFSKEELPYRLINNVRQKRSYEKESDIYAVSQESKPQCLMIWDDWGWCEVDSIASFLVVSRQRLFPRTPARSVAAPSVIPVCPSTSILPSPLWNDNRQSSNWQFSRICHCSCHRWTESYFVWLDIKKGLRAGSLSKSLYFQ